MSNSFGRILPGGSVSLLTLSCAVISHQGFIASIRCWKWCPIYCIAGHVLQDLRLLVLCVCKEYQYTHDTCVLLRQVNSAAAALAGRLSLSGVSAGCSVGVLLPRGFELVVSVMAIWKAGACYVPMDPDFPEERLAIYAEVGAGQGLRR
jgi:hypothetical protein